MRLGQTGRDSESRKDKKQKELKFCFMCLAVSTATRPYTTEMKVQSQRAAGVCECERYMNSTRSGKYKSKKMEAEKNNESEIAAER